MRYRGRYPQEKCGSKFYEVKCEQYDHIISLINKAIINVGVIIYSNLLFKESISCFFKLSLNYRRS